MIYKTIFLFERELRPLSPWRRWRSSGRGTGLAATSADVANGVPARGGCDQEAARSEIPGRASRRNRQEPLFGLFEVQFDNQMIYTDARRNT
jgi:hypothetical protein